MAEILVRKIDEDSNHWVFKVNVDLIDFKVILPKAYWQKLTNQSIEPDRLIIESFKFLLARESKEDILKEFELPLIQSYFPEYEDSMAKLLTE